MGNIGLNIDEIRNLNKLIVYSVKNGGESTPIFEAYMKNAIGTLNASVKDPSSFSDQLAHMASNIPIIGGILRSKVAGAVAGVAADFGNLGGLAGQGFEAANEINWNFNYKFNGTEKFSHTFTCELVTKDDYLEDVIKPLWNLLKYVLPSESGRLGETQLWEAGSESAKRFVQLLEGAARKSFGEANVNNILENEYVQKIGKYFKTIASEIGDSASTISQINKPEQLRGGMSHTRLRIGDYIIIDDVIITKVDFDIPFLYYEGGLFDNVTVKIDVKGNRKLTLDHYDWIRHLANGNLRKYWGREGVEGVRPLAPKGPTLNSQFGGLKKPSNTNTASSNTGTFV